MATKFGLVSCLLWVSGAFAHCGDDPSWYGGVRTSGLEDYPSVEDRPAPSFEDRTSEEYYPMKQQRSLRSSRYTPSYEYGRDYRQDSGDWERYGPNRKSHYDVHKNRRKYGTYGKSSRGDYTVKGALGVNAYERRKTSRAAKYTGGEGATSYSKSTSLTFKAVPPKANCAQNLLIGCTPTVTRVPCSASSHYAPEASYYPPAPMYHPAPAPAVHYGMSHPGSYGTYGPPPPPPMGHYSPVHHAHSSGYPKGPAMSDPYGKPAESAHGHGPSYKAATPEEMPGFAAPVRENLGESTKQPVISAFPKPTDVPTASANATLPKGASNGTDEQGSATTTVNPMPVLTPAPEPTKEDNDAFWGVESNVESSTDVAEESTAR